MALRSVRRRRVSVPSHGGLASTTRSRLLPCAFISLSGIQLFGATIRRCLLQCFLRVWKGHLSRNPSPRHFRFFAQYSIYIPTHNKFSDTLFIRRIFISISMILKTNQRLHNPSNVQARTHQALALNEDKYWK
jgi:hypothetical protein